MMKRIFLSFLVVLFLQPASSKVTVKLATVAPVGSPYHELLMELGEKWRKATNGEVQVKVYAGGVAGDERDVVRKMRIGQLQAGAMTVEGLTEISRNMNAFYIPLLFESKEELSYVREQLSPGLKKELQEKGFRLLLWSDVGWAYWFTRVPISTPADLRKLKIFTWAGDYHSSELFKRGNFNAVALSSMDGLMGLQTGMIDALPATPIISLSFQWFGIASHMLDLKWGPIVGGVVIMESTWKSIPQEYHDDLIKICEEIEKKSAAFNQKDEEAIQVMQKYGLKVHKISAEQKDEWKNLTKTFYPVIRGYLVPEDIFDKTVALKEELIKKSKNK